MLELEDVFSRFLKMGKDSAARIELGRSFHQMGTVNEKVCESDFVPLWDGTVMRRSLAECKLLYIIVYFIFFNSIQYYLSNWLTWICQESYSQVTLFNFKTHFINCATLCPSAVLLQWHHGVGLRWGRSTAVLWVHYFWYSHADA